ncbi:TolC family protein [bacterium]|nr:TolC family protein [bacterium]MBU1994274.1 TolC family protein [bacterium]
MQLMNGRKQMLSVYTKYFKHSIVACALMVVSAGNLGALEFREAIETTMKTSPVVEERLHAYRQTIQDYENAYGGYYPVLNVGADIGYSDRNWNESSIYTDRSKHIEQYYVELKQNLFAGFSTINATAQEKARIASAAWYFMEMANDHALETGTKYLEVLKQKELLNIEQSSLAKHEQLFNDMAEQEEAGVSRKSDMDEIRSKLALAYANVRIQQNNLQDALIKFHRVFGEYIPAEEFLMPDLNLQMPQSIREVSKIALRRNPTLLVMNYEIQAHQEEYEINKENFYPQIDASLRHSYNVNSSLYDGEFHETLALVSLKYNLFNGTRDSALLQKNRSAIQEQSSRMEKLKRETIEGTQLAWSSFENLNVIIPFIQRHAELNTQRLDSYKEDFNLGYRTLLDLLIVHDDYVSSQKKLVENEIDLQIAKIRILDAMGELTDALNINMRQYVGLSAHVKTDEIEDSEKIVTDSDEDNVTAKEDVCSNTPKGSWRDYVGCANMVKLDDISFDVPSSVTKDIEYKEDTLEKKAKVQKPKLFGKKQETTLPYVEAPAYRNGNAVFYFDKSSFNFTGGEQKRVESFIETLSKQDKIIVYGYTDTALSNDESAKLAAKRCKEVKKILVSGGVQAGNIILKPIGAQDQIIKTGDGIREPLNRRVEIKIMNNNENVSVPANH